MNGLLSAVCISIPDTQHQRVTLIGLSGRPGNTLIVRHTSVIYTTLPAVSPFIIGPALRTQTRKNNVLNFVAAKETEM